MTRDTESTTIFDRLKHLGRNMVDCGLGLNCSSTVVELAHSLWHCRCIFGHSWAFGVKQGITDTLIRPDSPLINHKYEQGGYGSTGLNHASRVSNHG